MKTEARIITWVIILHASIPPIIITRVVFILHMIDYFTGYDYKKNVWFYNLPGSFDFWERHYNQNGTKIMPMLENGCYDRLSMAKKGIQELVDMIAAQNAKVTGDGLRSRVAFWSFADEYRINHRR